MTHRLRLGSTLAALVAALHGAVAAAQTGAAGGEWRHYGGDNAASRYTPLDQINESNVARLQIAWRRPALDAAVLAQSPQMRAGGSFRGTPLMIDGVLYAPNATGFVEAFDPGTGGTLWVEPPMEPGANGYRGASTRGIAYWKSGEDVRILVQHSEHLLALDANSGKPIPTFGTNGRVYLSESMGSEMRYTWTGAPLVIRDVVVLGMSPFDEFANKEAMRSDVLAYDVRSGASCAGNST